MSYNRDNGPYNPALEDALDSSLAFSDRLIRAQTITNISYYHLAHIEGSNYIGKIERHLLLYRSFMSAERARELESNLKDMEGLLASRCAVCRHKETRKCECAHKVFMGREADPGQRWSLPYRAAFFIALALAAWQIGLPAFAAVGLLILRTIVRILRAILMVIKIMWYIWVTIK